MAVLKLPNEATLSISNLFHFSEWYLGTSLYAQISRSDVRSESIPYISAAFGLLCPFHSNSLPIIYPPSFCVPLVTRALEQALRAGSMITTLDVEVFDCEGEVLEVMGVL